MKSVRERGSAVTAKVAHSTPPHTPIEPGVEPRSAVNNNIRCQSTFELTALLNRGATLNCCKQHKSEFPPLFQPLLNGGWNAEVL